MMELKVYQRNALDVFTRWLETLEDTQLELETAIAALEQTSVPNKNRTLKRGLVFLILHAAYRILCRTFGKQHVLHMR